METIRNYRAAKCCFLWDIKGGSHILGIWLCVATLFSLVMLAFSVKNALNGILYYALPAVAYILN